MAARGARWGLAGPPALAIILYWNTLGHTFVYDDRPAVLDNPVVTGAAPLARLLTSDYWGVPLAHHGSHKSFRPLTSLSFRLDWALAPASPALFHLTNLLLHGLATHLFHRLLLALLPRPATALAAALLFAAHPVHCEAVAGVVGRAELLSAVFFLLTLLAHARHGWGPGPALLAAAATLAKEQGVTVLGVCLVLEVAGRPSGPWRRGALQIVLTLVAVLSLRAAALGGSLPTFSRADNPASHSSSGLTRGLTFLHLPAASAWLLLCPAALSYDWSMDAVPLLSSLGDPRNLLSLLLYSALALLLRPLLPLLPALLSQKQPAGHGPRPSSGSLPGPAPALGPAPAIALALALLVLPFLPATNIFFYVGFVLAERLLYLPSLGHCLLVALGLDRLRALRPRLAALGLLGLLLAGGLRTLGRNGDWASEERLFASGIATNPAKSLSNLGTVLHGRGRPAQAEAAFREALGHRANMADTHYNLGVLLQGQARLGEAASAYRAAISFRPQLALAHLNLGLTYSELGRQAEALETLDRAGKLSDAGLKDPAANEAARLAATFHLGKLLLEGGQATRALPVLQACWARGHGAGAANLLGEAHERLGRPEEAEEWYARSLRSNPAHVPAHLTLARMLARNESRAAEAEGWFRRAQEVAPGEARVYSHYGLYLLDRARPAEAAAALAEAARLAPSEYDAAFNAAVAAREAGALAAAETWYRRAVALRPEEPAGHMNLGALLHLAGRLREAEAEYLAAVSLGPVEELTRTNLRRLHAAMHARRMEVRSVEGL